MLELEDLSCGEKRWRGFWLSYILMNYNNDFVGCSVKLKDMIEYVCTI